MSRYIDADALMERFAQMQKVKPDKDGREYACNFRSMSGEPSAEWFTVEDAVENAPTVDAVPVVRCKECRHNKGEKVWRDGEVTIDCDNGMGYPPPNWFCADGERRSDDRI